ncbi:MAG TPA: trypsin-like peptidase domain-containing protein [Saprospiraceae bacterium]|nr:trypsin-like peptidase domain-containing protein [Saprospiraceae bacterium]
MKKYLPFLITGVLSAGIALVIFSFLGKPNISVEARTPLAVFTNRSPFDYTSALFTPPGSSDLVTAANIARQAVVYIAARTTSTAAYFSRRSYSGSTGSGVIVSENGYIATNHHVIADGEEIIVLMENGHEYEAKIVGSDPSTDLALLKIDASDLPYLSFGDSDSLMVGEWVMAVGNPFRLYSTVTAGIVSAKSRNINILDEAGIESFIQTDAAVNPGNSGGALVNTRGQLVGINTAIMTFSGQYEGFSFAVPANLASKVLEDIREHGSVRRGWLGVVIKAVDNNTAREVGLNDVTGVMIERVNDESAADEAGLKSGDVIVTIDGRKINSSPDFMGKIGQHRPGDVLNVEFFREGKKKEARVKLSDSRNGVTKDLANAKAANQILTEIGMEVRDLNVYEESRLPRDGVIVSAIKELSQIDEVNMEENFVITRVNGIPVNSVTGFKSELEHSGSNIYLQGYYEEFPGDFAYSLELK